MNVKWGVIGSAGIARRRTIPEGIVNAENAELAAVFDINTEANAEVAAEYGARPCASEAELLAADVDVVYIATPAFEHYAQIQRAAEAGKHVLCEKPLSLTVEECDRALDICAAKGVQLGTGFMMRFHAQHQAALEYLREGRLGLPILGRAQLSCWYPPIPGAWRQEPEKAAAAASWIWAGIA